MLNFRLLIILILVGNYNSTFSNGFNQNSFGPKGMGMGGAFIGAANDYTAVFWNPASIIQLTNPEISFFLNGNIPFGSYQADATVNKTTIVNTRTIPQMSLSPNFAAYLPLTNGDFSIALGGYEPVQSGVQWDKSKMTKLSGGKEFDWIGSNNVYTFLLSSALKINKRASIGMSLNLNYGNFEIKRPQNSIVSDSSRISQYSENSSGWGVSGSFGLLLRPVDFLQFGLSFKTQSIMTYSGDAQLDGFKVTKLINYLTQNFNFKRNIDMPFWFGFGVAFFPIERLTIEFDAHYTQWSESENLLLGDFTNTKSNKILKDTLALNWSDCLQLRIGINYNLSDYISIRAGYYHDPNPSPDDTYLILFPNITCDAATAGFSCKFGQIGIDFGLEYLIGSQREITTAVLIRRILPTPLFETNNLNVLGISLGVNYILSNK